MAASKPKEKTNLHEGHRKRVKKLFLEKGLDCFEPHVILEFLLFYTKPRVNTNETAHLLLNKFGSLSNVFEAPHEILSEVPGVGPESATLIKLIPEISRCYLSDKSSEHDVINSSEEAAEYLKPHYVGRTEEFYIMLLLDGRGNVKKLFKMSSGSATSVDINLNALIKEVVAINPAGVVLSHNHPQGYTRPSYADFHFTKVVCDLLSTIDVKVCDHIIFNCDDYLCLSQMNSMDCGKLVFAENGTRKKGLKMR